MSRRILLVAHPRRPEALVVARGVIERLTRLGIDVSLQSDEARALDLKDSARVHVARVQQQAAEGCDLIVVLGGDGTILRGAEMSRGTGAPLLGVNLGHVGFLAEAEREDATATVDHIVSRAYQVEERMTLAVTVHQEGAKPYPCWALNEVSVEKAARERMLEVAVEIDGKPLSAFGCDGIVVSTPTGSTAYAFSLGGPVIWPDVEAILMVPNAAHALFSRPIVVSPTSRLAVEVIPQAEGHGIMWCDGRRQLELRPGARIEVTRSDVPVRLARLNASPFTDRLVAKFDLSVAGWRGNGRSR
ncbi:MAG TPA: NAD kinase [Lapillicoccus sp.]|nr:NAD kinase [Lapillicoccus sp.]